MVVSEKELMFEYLDDLRESGEVNMFGSGTYLVCPDTKRKMLLWNG